jgi:RNA polymerase sigma-70 factor, ECF subfamily
MNRDARTSSKDAEGWARLYRQHGQKLFRRACALLRDEEAAMDVLQEVFLRALSSGSPLDELTTPFGWLFRVTTNLCYRRRRDEGRRRRALMVLSLTSHETPRREVELEHSVRDVVGRLPPSCQKLAVFYFVDEMTQAEIAVTVKAPRRTVAYRLDRLRASMVASIVEQGRVATHAAS